MQVQSGDTLTTITDDILTKGLESGILEFGYQLGSYKDRVKVTYTGGYWLDDGGSMPAGAKALPHDLKRAFIMQCQHEAEMTGLLRTAGLRQSKEKDEAVSKAMPDSVELILKRYMRHG